VAGPDADLGVFSGTALRVVPANATLTFSHTYRWWGERRRRRHGAGRGAAAAAAEAAAACGRCPRGRRSGPPGPTLAPGTLGPLPKPLAPAAAPAAYAASPLAGSHRKLRVTARPNVTLSRSDVPLACRRARAVILGPLTPGDVDAASFLEPEGGGPSAVEGRRSAVEGRRDPLAQRVGGRRGWGRQARPPRRPELRTGRAAGQPPLGPQAVERPRPLF
jgi:hypothetical protein